LRVPLPPCRSGADRGRQSASPRIPGGLVSHEQSGVAMRSRACCASSQEHCGQWWLVAVNHAATSGVGHYDQEPPDRVRRGQHAWVIQPVGDRRGSRTRRWRPGRGRAPVAYHFERAIPGHRPQTGSGHPHCSGEHPRVWGPRRPRSHPGPGRAGAAHWGPARCRHRGRPPGQQRRRRRPGAARRCNGATRKRGGPSNQDWHMAQRQLLPVAPRRLIPRVRGGQRVPMIGVANPTSSLEARWTPTWTPSPPHCTSRSTSS
jgi:hypothetical protein